MSLKSILFSLSVRKICKLMSVVVFALCMISMAALSGFVVLTVNADTLSDVYLTATPSSCNVGDTITLVVGNTPSGSIYSYSCVIDGNYEHSITGYISDSVYYYTPVDFGAYKFYVSIIPSSGSPSITVYSNSVVVSSDESSDESSEESSDESSEESSEESSDESSEESSEESSDESSFDPMNWMPSNWRGDDYVQPSAESTPDLSYEELPSDLNEFWVSENLADIIARAFRAFPAKLIVLMIPTIICLFVAWWLHK